MFLSLSVSGFLDMLTKAQCCRVEDQRGLLTKEQLELPQFLQLPSDQGQDTEGGKPPSTDSCPTNSREESEAQTLSTSSSGDGEKEISNSSGSEPKDLKETTV